MPNNFIWYIRVQKSKYTREESVETLDKSLSHNVSDQYCLVGNVNETNPNMFQFIFT